MENFVEKGVCNVSVREELLKKEVEELERVNAELAFKLRRYTAAPYKMDYYNRNRDKINEKRREKRAKDKKDKFQENQKESKDNVCNM